MDDFPHKLGIPDWEFRLVIGRSKIDYGQEKEAANRIKHKYSLESARQLFERMLLPTGSPLPHCTSDGFEQNGEIRHQHMGVDDSGKVIFVVTTMRSDETVWIISCRPAKRKERDEFYSNTGYREPQG